MMRLMYLRCKIRGFDPFYNYFVCRINFFLSQVEFVLLLLHSNYKSIS